MLPGISYFSRASAAEILSRTGQTAVNVGDSAQWSMRADPEAQGALYAMSGYAAQSSASLGWAVEPSRRRAELGCTSASSKLGPVLEQWISPR